MRFGKVGRMILWQRGDVRTSQEWMSLVESILRNESSTFCFLYNDVRETIQKRGLSVLDVTNGTQIHVPIKCSILGYRPANDTLGYLCKFWWYTEKYEDKNHKNQQHLVLTSVTNDVLQSTRVQRYNIYRYYLKKLLKFLEIDNFEIETLRSIKIKYIAFDENKPKIKSHLCCIDSYDKLLESIEADYSCRNSEYQGVVDAKVVEKIDGELVLEPNNK